MNCCGKFSSRKMDRVIFSLVFLILTVTRIHGGYMQNKFENRNEQQQQHQKKDSHSSGDQETAQGQLYHIINSPVVTPVVTPAVVTPVVVATDGYAVYSPVDIGLDYDYVIPEGADLICQKGFNIGTYVGPVNPFDAGICFFEYYLY